MATALGTLFRERDSRSHPDAGKSRPLAVAGDGGRRSQAAARIAAQEAMDKHLAQAYTAGRWAREAGRERLPPTYAPNALGKPLRDEWDRGYMSLGPLTEPKRKK